MAKKSLLSIILLLTGLLTYAQQPDAAGLKQLKRDQDTLQALSQEIFSGKGDDGRARATDEFIPLLVRTLKTKLPIHVAEDPLRAVVRGTGAALKNIQHYRKVLMT